jgi:medium-chain acyl-[acyl-carrier-protein] hydrolase
MRENPWLVRSGPRPKALVRMYCFHYAGGGASVYRAWSTELSMEIEICAIQLPGHESRICEKPVDRVEPLAAAVASAIAEEPDVRPFAFFGHSMGALLAFETARELRRRALRAPLRLCVSAARAPQLPNPDPPIHRLPDTEFIAKLREYDGTPEEVLQHREVMELLMPILRADFAIGENYQYRTEPPLESPISAFGGAEDRGLPVEHLEAWRAQTLSTFDFHVLTGGHFYLIQERAILLRRLTAALAADLKRAQVS